jgi:hypothetical protein
VSLKVFWFFLTAPPADPRPFGPLKKGMEPPAFKPPATAHTNERARRPIFLKKAPGRIASRALGRPVVLNSDYLRARTSLWLTSSRSLMRPIDITRVRTHACSRTQIVSASIYFLPVQSKDLHTLPAEPLVNSRLPFELLSTEDSLAVWIQRMNYWWVGSKHRKRRDKVVSDCVNHYADCTRSLLTTLTALGAYSLRALRVDPLT